jgi:hypothetical protein
MSDNMIERVARAIAKEHGDDFDAVPRDKGHWIDERGTFDGRYRDVNEPFQPHYIAMARAAIAAMREPTEEMLEAGNSWYSAKLTWQGMIDAALKGDGG